jgi:phenylalanyl-tRNA synthetase beta chain
MACDLADRGGRIERVKTVFPFDTPLGRSLEVPQRLDKSLSIPVGEFSRLLGVKVTPAEVDNVLERYGCDVSIDGDTFLVQPHPTRGDYLHAVDAVEDFTIGRGYETFTPRMPQEFSPGRLDPLFVLENKVRDHMIGMEYEEMISNILVARASLRDKMNLDQQEVVEVGNVMNENYAVLRDAVLPSLLQAESHSGAAAYPHRLFEAGEVAVFDQGAPKGSQTELHLAALVAHAEVTLSEAHADAEFLLFQLGVDFELAEVEHPSFLAGRAARIMVGDQQVGILGEIHPEVLERWQISMPVSAFEINLNALL